MEVNFTSYAALFFLAIFCISCKQKKDDTAVIEAIRQTGQLYTVEYSLRKIIKATDDQTWYKLGDRKILISAEAIVKGGVDLQQLSEDDVNVQDKNIQLRLPRPQIFSIAIPPEKIVVQYEDVSFFRNRFSAAEKEALLALAEKQIRRLADSLGVVQTAGTNAVTFLEGLLRKGGFENITIQYKK